MLVRRIVSSAVAIVALGAAPRLLHAEEEEIIVTGKRLQQNTWDIMDMFTYLGGYDSVWAGGGYLVPDLIDENTPPPEDPCAVAEEDFQEQADKAKASGTKVVLVGENHTIGESTTESQATQVPHVVDTLLSGVSRGCVTFEAPSYSSLPNTGYKVAANYLTARGYQTFFIDGAIDYSYAPGDVNHLNTRDAYMADLLNRISPFCDRIVAMNGIHHLTPHASGRVTLADRLGTSAKKIDGREKEACQP